MRIVLAGLLFCLLTSFNMKGLGKKQYIGLQEVIVSDKPLPETSEQRDLRLQWWHNSKFGLFIHWGIYSVPAGEWKGKQMPEIGEWIMSKFRIPIPEYTKFASVFNPYLFDAGTWVDLAREAGMKYMIITAKHHDGFAMYQSFDPYNVVDATPLKRDVVRELSAACAQRQMRFGFYYSQALDWHEPDAGGTDSDIPLNCGTMSWGNNWDFPPGKGENFAQFFEKKVKPQLMELLTKYGVISNIWFDVPFTINRAQSAELYNMVRKFQPACIMNSRLGNGLGDYDSAGDNEIPESGKRRVFETPATMNDTWGFKHFDHNWKSTETLIHQLVEVVSKGGNYLLNVGPTAEGIIPDESVIRLKEIGSWLKVNGESIYGTIAWEKAPPVTAKTIQFYTAQANNLYLIVTKWPDQPIVVNQVEKAKSVNLLGYSGNIKFSITGNSIIIVPPSIRPDAPPGQYAWVFKINSIR